MAGQHQQADPVAPRAPNVTSDYERLKQNAAKLRQAAALVDVDQFLSPNPEEFIKSIRQEPGQ